VRNVRMLGLCLIAIFAMSAVAAASASAAEEPEYLSCVKAAKVGKTYTGGYNNKTCTEVNAKSEGKYATKAVASGTKFTSKSKGATFTVDGTVVKCKKDTDAGEFFGGGTIVEEITFSDCGVNGNKKDPCESTGAGAGTIKTNRLSDFLVYLNAEETQIGVILLGTGAWAEFNCGAKSFAVDGTVLGTLENTAKGDTVTFKVSGGHQEHTTLWESGNEETGLKLYTEPGEAEATLETTDEQSSKGIGAYPF
jgi:hypothetical protein